MNVPYIFSGDTLTVFLAGKPYTIHKDDDSYNRVSKWILEGTGTEEEILPLLSKKVAILWYSGDSLEYNEDRNSFVYKGRGISGGIVDRILYMRKKGYDFDHLLAFLNNLTLNPSEDSVQGLYDFLEHNSLPITQDGHFLAYKRVSDSYYDTYSGRYYYGVGETVSMPREEVVHDRNMACASGLHAANYRYAKGFSHDGHLMVVKINPKDVVSVPYNYDMDKMRVCKMQVLSEITEESRIRPYYTPDNEATVDKDEALREEEGLVDHDIEFDVDEHLDERENEEEPYFQDGDKVKWVSQASGRSMEKIGYFVDYVLPGASVDKLIIELEREGRLPKDYSIRALGSNVSERNHRALVLVTKITNSWGQEIFPKKPSLYSPRVEILEKIE